MLSIKTNQTQRTNKKKELSREHHTSWFQIILQSYSSENSTGLAKTRLMDTPVNQIARNKPKDKTVN